MRMNRVWMGAFIVSLSMALLLGSSPAVRAGFVLTDDEGNQTLISGGKLKSMPQEPGGEWLVADFGAGRITLISPEEERAYSGTIEQYCRFMETMFSQMGESVSEPLEKGASEKSEKPVLKIVKEGPGGSIAGFPTTKYKVTIDGKLYEEIWVTDDPSLMKELGNVEHIRAFNNCASTMEQSGLESDPAYRKIFSSGWVIRQLSYEEGEPEVMENTVSSQQKPISGSEFKVPPDYEILPFSEAFDQEARDPKRN